MRARPALAEAQRAAVAVVARGGAEGTAKMARRRALIHRALDHEFTTPGLVTQGEWPSLVNSVNHVLERVCSRTRVQTNSRAHKR